MQECACPALPVVDSSGVGLITPENIGELMLVQSLRPSNGAPAWRTAPLHAGIELHLLPENKASFEVFQSGSELQRQGTVALKQVVQFDYDAAGNPTLSGRQTTRCRLNPSKRITHF